MSDASKVMYEELFSRSGLSLERLKTLCEVASSGGISKAAGGDPVRQSQFSRQLRELETFFDVELTRRRGRNAELTAAGKKLATLGREILDSLAEYSQAQRGEVYTLRLGAGESLLQWVVLPRIGRLQAVIPKAVFSFRNLRREDALSQLQESQIDFGLVAEGPLPEGFAHERLGVMRYRLFVGQKWSPGAAPRWQDVINRPFVGLEGEGRQMRAARRILEEKGLALRPSVLCASLPGVALVLEQHDGFAILPEAAQRAGIVAVNAPFLSKLERDIWLVWSERRMKTRGVLPAWRRCLMEELAWT